VSGKPDRPEDYQTVTWELTEGEGATELRITEQNLPSREAAETSEQAWNTALEKLKELLET